MCLTGFQSPHLPEKPLFSNWFKKNNLFACFSRILFVVSMEPTVFSTVYISKVKLNGSLCYYFWWFLGFEFRDLSFLGRRSTLEPHLQPFLLWFFWTYGLAFLPEPAWTSIPLFYIFCYSGMTDMPQFFLLRWDLKKFSARASLEPWSSWCHLLYSWDNRHMPQHPLLVEVGSRELFAWAGLELQSLISAFQVTRITGVSHQCLTLPLFLKDIFNGYCTLRWQDSFFFLALQWFFFNLLSSKLF
jgi:hypothetical protein